MRNNIFKNNTIGTISLLIILLLLSIHHKTTKNPKKTQLILKSKIS